MSKVSMPRPRYVAFRVEAARALSRRAVAGALKAAAKAAGWTEGEPVLTRYEWPHGIVRVEHVDAARARALLAGVSSAQEGDARVAVKVTPLSTSGTLLALTDRVKVLRKRDPAK